jgi:hypothetical protein
MGSQYFRSYQQNLMRVLMAELVEQTLTDETPRRMSIVSPCTHTRPWQAPADTARTIGNYMRG